MVVTKHRTRLYLSVPMEPLPDFEHDVDVITRLASRLDIASVAIETGKTVGTDERFRSSITRLQALGIAVLLALSHEPEEDRLTEQLASVPALGADGVHLGPLHSTENTSRKARAFLGDTALIGVDCALSRHQAMVNGEQGADYIAFSRSGGESMEDLKEMVNWWQTLFELPCVACNPCNQKELESLVQLPVDFALLPPSLWRQLAEETAFSARLIAHGLVAENPDQPPTD